MNNDHLFTTQEAADILGVPIGKLHTLIHGSGGRVKKDGSRAGIKFKPIISGRGHGSRTMFSIEDIDKVSQYFRAMEQLRIAQMRLCK